MSYGVNIEWPQKWKRERQRERGGDRQREKKGQRDRESINRNHETFIYITIHINKYFLAWPKEKQPSESYARQGKSSKKDQPFILKRSWDIFPPVLLIERDRQTDMSNYRIYKIK